MSQAVGQSDTSIKEVRAQTGLSLDLFMMRSDLTTETTEHSACMKTINESKRAAARNNGPRASLPVVKNIGEK